MDDAPWALLGEAMVAFVARPRRGLKPLPPGIGRMPGPMVVLAEQFVDSPVGPYAVLSIAEPARSGLRTGLHISTCVVNNGEARRIMRQRWGVPAELGALRWSSEAGTTIMTWEEHELVIEATSDRRPFQTTFPVRMLQQRTDGPVGFPLKLKALVRSSRVSISIPEDDMFAFLAGNKRGFKLSNANMRLEGARRRRGLLSLRAPKRLAEPGVLGMDNKTLVRQR